MAYDSAATKAKFLDAAFVEFVEHGLAGARVDRIAAAAGANKQAIYAYFGSKEALFDAVLTNRLGALLTTVPMTADDLTGYALALYDYLLDHPEYLRLTMWKRLERPDATTDEIAAYLSKLDQIQAATQLDAYQCAPIDVLLLVIGVASAFESAPPSIRGLDPHAADAADRRARERRALRSAVSAIIQALVRQPSIPEGN